jgi:hypothetical protein
MPSIICGKVDDKTKNIINETYKEYNKKTKTIMANFICDNGKTKTNPKISLDPDEYSLIKAGSR